MGEGEGDRWMRREIVMNGGREASLEGDELPRLQNDFDQIC